MSVENKTWACFDHLTALSYQSGPRMKLYGNPQSGNSFKRYFYTIFLKPTINSRHFTNMKYSKFFLKMLYDFAGFSFSLIFESQWLETLYETPKVPSLFVSNQNEWYYHNNTYLNDKYNELETHLRTITTQKWYFNLYFPYREKYIRIH